MNASKIEDLLASRSFDELNAGEKNLVLKELGSEEAYNSLRKISLALVTDKADLSPDPRTLALLKGELRDAHRTESWVARFVSWRVPAYSFIPAVLLIMLIGSKWLTENGDRVKKSPVLVGRIDTVFVKAPSDTVFVERVIVKYRENTTKENSKTDFSIVRNVNESEAASEGVTMKDKEELESLLVSGS